MNRIRVVGLLVLILATVGCDRVTKHIAEARLADAPMQSLWMDTVRLEYAENTGAFLSLGADWSPAVRTWVFVVGNSVMLLVLVISALRGRWSGLPLVGVTLFAAGGISNLADRIVRGNVVDFLNVGIGTLRTGIFNVADVALMIGVVFVAFHAKAKVDDDRVLNSDGLGSA